MDAAADRPLDSLALPYHPLRLHISVPLSDYNPVATTEDTCLFPVFKHC